MARTTCLILTPSPFVLQNLIFIISHFLLDVATPIYFAPLSFALHPYFTHIHYFFLAAACCLLFSSFFFKYMLHFFPPTLPFDRNIDLVPLSALFI